MGLVLPFGLAVGITMGAVGAGGSIVAIPVLVHVAGLDVHAATTASLLVVGSAAVVGTVPHARAGRVRLASGIAFGASGVVGAVVGSWLNARAGDDVLMLGFAALALTMATLLTGRVRSPEPREPAPRDAAIRDAAPLEHSPRGRVLALGSAVGLLTGLFGVGGGFIVVPALIFLLGFSTRDAIGTSLVVIAINAGVSMLARLPTLELDWSVVGPFAGAGVAGVLLGGLVSQRTRTARLGFALAGLLVVVAGVTGLPAASRLAGG